MLRLEEVSPEPRWCVLLPGDPPVELLLAPVDAAMEEAARHQAVTVVSRLKDDMADLVRMGQPVANLPNLLDDHVFFGAVYMHTAQALGRVAIRDWRGVGNAAGTALEPLTPEAIDKLLRRADLCRAFMGLLLGPRLALGDEGNGSGSVATGNSAADPITAATAAATMSAAATATPAPTA